MGVHERIGLVIVEVLRWEVEEKRDVVAWSLVFNSPQG